MTMTTTITAKRRFWAETGDWNGEDAVRIICKHQATAEFFARHLYHFFVADEPPVPQWSLEPPKDPEAIAALSRAYFDSGYSIKATLETLFKSDFFKSESVRYSRIKSPAEMVIGTMRLAGPDRASVRGRLLRPRRLREHGTVAAEPPQCGGMAGRNRLDQHRAHMWGE